MLRLQQSARLLFAARHTATSIPTVLTKSERLTLFRMGLSRCFSRPMQVSLQKRERETPPKVILCCDGESLREKSEDTAERLNIPLIVLEPEPAKAADDDFADDFEEDFDEDEEEEKTETHDDEDDEESSDHPPPYDEIARQEDRFILTYRPDGLLEMERMLKSPNQIPVGVACSFYNMHLDTIGSRTRVRSRETTSRGVMHRRHPLLRSIMRLMHMGQAEHLHDMPIDILNITAGFGRDAYQLMCHFSKDKDVSISVLQEDPILYEMIMNGREIASGELFAREALSRIKYLKPQDPLDYLTQETEKVFLHDIVYCDLTAGMKRSKEFSYQDRVDNVLRAYHGPFDEDRASEIILEALHSSQFGVINRTHKAKAPLVPDRLSRSFMDKDMRYDVYETNWAEMIQDLQNKKPKQN